VVEGLKRRITRFNNLSSHLSKCDMFTASSQTAGGEKCNQNSDAVPVTISEHAREQWAARTPAELSLKSAWEQSVSVVAPEADSTAARLYPPYNALLVVKHATVTTVLNNDGRLDTSGLTECPSCGDWIDPVGDDACPWCGEVCDEAARPGRITVSRGAL